MRFKSIWWVLGCFLGSSLLANCGGGGFSAPKSPLSLDAPSHTNETEITVFGKCIYLADDPKDIHVSGNFAESPLTLSCDSDKSFSFGITVSDELTELTATQDLETASASVIYDTTPPVVDITSPVDGATVATDVTISGTCEAGLRVELAGDIQSTIRLNCSTNNTFAGKVKFITQPSTGPRDLTATQIDLATNVGSHSVTYQYDNRTPGVPALTLAVDPGHPTRPVDPVASADTTPVINGSVTDAEGGMLFIYEDSSCNVLAGSEIIEPDGTVSITNISYANDGTDDGLHTYYMRAEGQNGRVNPGGCRISGLRYRLDTLNPVVTISSHSEGAEVVRGTTVALTGNCERQVPVEITMGGNTTVSNCNSSGNYTHNISVPTILGPLAVTYGQIDDANNSFTAIRNLVVVAEADVTPPNVTLTSITPGTTLVRGQVISAQGSCEDGLPVTLSGSALAGTSQGVCSSGAYSVDVTVRTATGNNLTIKATQTDGASNEGSTSVTVTVGQPPNSDEPYVTISTPVASSTFNVGSSIIVSGLCEAGASVSFSGNALENPSSVSCSSSGLYNTTLKLISTEAQGAIINASQTVAGFTGSFSTSINIESSLDVTPPPVSISTPLDGQKFAPSATTFLSGTCENDLDVQVTGSALVNAITLSCNEGQYFENIALTSFTGDLNIVVLQTDTSGNQGVKSISVNIESNDGGDQTPPNLQISSPSAGSNHQQNSVVAIKGQCEADLTVKLNGTALLQPKEGVCTTTGTFDIPVVLTGLVGSNKTFIATQTDAAGNTTTRVRSLNITNVPDTTPPDVEIISPQAGSSFNRGGSLVVFGTCEANVPVALSGDFLNIGVTTECSASGVFSKVVQLSHTAATELGLTATQTDASGNTGNHGILLDLISQADVTPPSVQITAPTNNSGHNSGQSLLVQGSCEAGSAPVYISGTALADSGSVICGSSGNFVVAMTLSASGGEDLSLQATQTDASGNMGISEVTIDVFAQANPEPPEVAIELPVLGGNYNRNSSVLLTGQCQPGLQVQISGSALSANKTTGCSAAGEFETVATIRSTTGTYVNIIAKQTDSAGRNGVDYVFVNVISDPDTTPPAVAITSHNSGDVLSVGDSLVISGTCESGLDVRVSGTALQSATVSACTGGNFSASAQLVNHASSSASLRATQVDGAGNWGIDSMRINVRAEEDTTPPDVMITSPSSGEDHVEVTSLTVAGTCEAYLPVQLSGPALQSDVSASCTAGGSFSREVILAVHEGSTPLNIIATQMDASGNTGNHSVGINILLTPEILITAPANDSEFIQGITINIVGECHAGLDIDISGNALSTDAMTTCSPGGTFQADVELTSTEGNNRTLKVTQQVTPIYEVSDEIRLHITDLPTNPEVTITSPYPNSEHGRGSSITVSGTCEPGFYVDVSGTALDSNVSFYCETTGNYVGVASLKDEELEDVTVIATQDINGMSGSAQVTISLTDEPPVPECGNAYIVSCRLGGKGTSDDPYLVNTVQCLKHMANNQNLSCHYKLYSDIDATATINIHWTPVGNSSVPFTGSFDGNGFKIQNLTVDSNLTHSGLFGRTQNAEIKNLTIENAVVNGLRNVGVLIGYGEQTSVEDVTIRGEITVDANPNNQFLNNSIHLGGLAGYLEGSLKNSKLNANLEITEITAKGNVSNSEAKAVGHKVGGLVGEFKGDFEDNIIEETALLFQVSGTINSSNSVHGNAGHRVGGLVGRINADPEDVIENYLFKGYAETAMEAHVSGNISVNNSPGPNGHRVGGVLGESGIANAINLYLGGTFVADVSGNFSGTSTGTGHLFPGHSVGAVIGSNVNTQFQVNQIYAVRPDGMTPEEEAQLPHFFTEVSGSEGSHSVGGLIGRTAKASFEQAFFAATNINIEVQGNRSMQVGGLIGDVYGEYGDETFKLEGAYIDGEQIIVAADSSTSAQGNKVGGLIGRIAYHTSPDEEENEVSSGMLIRRVAVEGMSTIIGSGGDGGPHYVGGIVGQIIEPHQDALVSKMEVGYVVDNVTLGAQAQNVVIGGLLGEYRRLDSGEYTTSGDDLDVTFAIENMFSLATYDTGGGAHTQGALGFLVGQCNMGNIARNGVVAQIDKSYGLPEAPPIVPVNLSDISGVVGRSIGMAQGPQSCLVSDARYGEEGGYPAQACLGCSTSNVDGLVAAELVLRASYPASWDFNNIWTIEEGVEVPLLRE